MSNPVLGGANNTTEIFGTSFALPTTLASGRYYWTAWAGSTGRGRTTP
jgi:hypothetical protein